jgi:hypothetical protein
MRRKSEKKHRAVLSDRMDYGAHSGAFMIWNDMALWERH